jgi:acyl dehydratase
MDTLSWTPDAECPRVFARLSGDHNPVHLDDEFARSAGFPSVIVHGMAVLGASARAAHVLAPAGSVLRKLDVRFANPVLPGQRVSFSGEQKEGPDGVRVLLSAVLDDEKRLMNPATFTFGARGGAYVDPPAAETAADAKDVAGEPFRFDAAAIAEYLAISACTARAEGEGIPPMLGLLGMTGALERAFKGVQPEKAGTWVHLRQAASFFRPVQTDLDYRCRIQAARVVLRTAPQGAHVSIPFVVEKAADGALLASGQCVLLYAFREAA